ncbi:MAG: tripartite tricarboxylate transporter substrate binding protein [Spirochaetia bacterium]|jgi:tripartite-type tricarboxylate transporter receptor subunit TctC|nr:tripartite tricarboxylate transporter substrate binding protein [Spirochaetia bacterium]
MKRLSIVLLCLLLVSGALFATGGSESTAKYPTKNITMICPWAAGGGTDAILRALSAAAEKQLGVTITVENRTGGAGAIGHSAIKNARPDGYTMGMVTLELNSLPQQGLIDYDYTAYDHVIRVNADAATITVKSDSPINSIKDFLEHCKKNPGMLNMGISAPGSPWHIAAALLANETGINYKYITFDGAAPAVTALAGGHIDAVSVSLPEIKSQLDAGNVKCLAIMDDKRSEGYPKIPTLKEEGYNIVYGAWRGISLPKGVDPAIQETIVKAFTEAMKDPAFINQAKNLNLALAYQPPDEFNRFLKENFDAITKTMKAIGLIK